MSSPDEAHAAPPLGAHMSIAGGMRRAVDRALEVRATALQVFVKSNRQWRARDLREGEADEFRQAIRAAGLQHALVAHASYLINLASSDRALRERSIAALALELDRCAELGIPYLVLHPGTHDGRPAAGLRRVAAALDRVGRRRREVRVLLEITAGQGASLGSSFEELARIIELSRVEDRLGVCFDTCHAFAAGYELRDGDSFHETFDRFDARLGLDRLRAFHLNDSRHERGSRRDRHQHIGRGHLGLAPFRLLVNDPRFSDRPMVLETPKGPQLDEDRANLAVLRRMIARR